MASSASAKSRTSSASASAGSKATRTPPSSAGSKKTLGNSSSTKSLPKSARPSDRLNPKTIDPFSNQHKNLSAFAAVYSSGGLPCRLIHGSVKHKLAWATVPEQVAFDPVLITLTEGLRETVHPYTFVSCTGFKELLEVPNSVVRTTPLLPKIAPPLRAALAHSNADVFERSLEALDQLSNAVGPALNPYLKNLLMPVSKRMNEKKFKDRAMDILQHLEENGGREVLPIIKSKVPTYSSVFG